VNAGNKKKQITKNQKSIKNQSKSNQLTINLRKSINNQTSKF